MATESPEKQIIFIIAGEESGDLHGAKLVEALKARKPDLCFVGHGGKQMEAAGVEIIERVENLAVMGFSEVIRHLFYFRRVMKDTVARIRTLQPLRIILIDYPGFNLRLARRLKSAGIPITYFILPQVWAWKENRIKTIQRHIDQALSIFPFEKDWFDNRGVETGFFGHPFADPVSASLSREEFFDKHGIKADDKLLVLFPGSRQQEIDRHWTSFLGTARLLNAKFPNLKIIVGHAPGVVIDPRPPEVLFESDEPQLALRYGHTALIASGTATLEAAVYNIPAVVAYRLSSPSYWLARRLVKLKYVSMVNLIADQPVVSELLQNDMTIERLTSALEVIMADGNEREKMLENYRHVRLALGKPGAYDRAAGEILKRTAK